MCDREPTRRTCMYLVRQNRTECGGSRLARRIAVLAQARMNKACLRLSGCSVTCGPRGMVGLGRQDWASAQKNVSRPFEGSVRRRQSFFGFLTGEPHRYECGDVFVLGRCHCCTCGTGLQRGCADCTHKSDELHPMCVLLPFLLGSAAVPLY